MQWKFINSNIITEVETGFTIRLISGAWGDPQDIAPDKTNISAYDQARLLRLRLEFAKELLTTKLAC
ncbi:MAG: hypothetical protein ACJAUP_002830 [Cellvibrionaceae bacterium]|jgi:hypothetical protein